MNTISDTQRIEFLEKWEPSIHQATWFTTLTQHVNKVDCPTLRLFCDYGINHESMLDTNNLDVLAWHYLPIQLQEIVINIWEIEKRPLSDEERITLQSESDKYWEDLHQLEEENSDK